MSLTSNISSPFVVITLTLSLITWLYIRKNRNATKLYPPGPKGLPLIQNLLDMSSIEDIHLTFTKWGRTYGPISHAVVLNEHIIVLNSYEAAVDLFEKRSQKYSGRRESIMANEMMGWNYLTPTLQPGEKLQAHRTMMHKYLQPSAIIKYESQEVRAVHRLLSNLLNTPDKFLGHIRSAAVGAIIMITYGNEVKSEDDIYVTIGDEGIKWVAKALTPASYLVDYLPWLKYIPDWCPGTQWKADGRVGRDIASRMLNELYEITKDRIAKGTSLPCIMEYLLDDNDETSKTTMHKDSRNKELRVAETLATMYTGGSDSTVSALQSAILAVVLNGDIVKKAQDEIDRVIGKCRLPTLADRRMLPYLEGIVREALRWNPVGPLGVPHRCEKEDIYKGYLIPAKSTVIPNIWAMMRDPVQYPDPQVFRPERWLDSDGKLLAEDKSPRHPNKALFGFGRRICPGRYLAEDLTFLILANIFAVFDIHKAKDDFGQPITPAGTYSSSKLFYDPDPFVCSIKPRSQAAESLIREAAESIS